MVVLQRLRLAPLTISIQNVDKCQFYKRIPIPDIYLCLGWRMFWNQKYACNHVAFYTITDTWIENVNLSKTDTLTYAHLLLKIRRMSLLLLKRNAPKQNKNRIEASISITLTHIVTIQVKLRLGKHSKYETKGNCECFLFRGGAIAKQYLYIITYSNCRYYDVFVKTYPRYRWPRHCFIKLNTSNMCQS